jgi:hypothetical protein
VKKGRWRRGLYKKEGERLEELSCEAGKMEERAV